MKYVLPSLVEHYCSPGYRGGFFERVRTGTYMGHIIEHIALELQELAGTPVGFGRTRATSTPGVYNVVFEYVDEQAGRYAGRAAVRLCQSIVDTGTYPQEELAQDLADLRGLLLSARAMVQLGYGVHQKRIQATLSSFSGILAVELACDKEGTKTILKDGGIPVPRGTVIQYLDELSAAIEEVGGFPIVIKPLDGNHGPPRKPAA